ncbi:MAG: hypothetical protein OXG34_07840 [bacterium]|nr:hypothetical protein [bacterium]
MDFLSRRRVALAVLAVACLLGPVLGSAGAGGQEKGSSEIALQEVQARNDLIAAQESLLNVYRCRFNVDTEVVPDGCVDGQPAGGTIDPALFEGTSTESDIAVRDSLIQAQESLLNNYRCLFKVDAGIVPGGCNRIAVIADNDLWVVNGDGEDEQRLVNDEDFRAPDTSPFLESPVWSPDSTRIAFAVNYHDEPWDNNSDKGEIWVINHDATGLEKLVGPESSPYEEIRQLTWSPDGSRLAYLAYCCSRLSRDVYPDLWVIDSNGTNANLLAESVGAIGYSWSPDGTKIVYSRVQTNNIWTVSVDGTSQRELANVGAAFRPVWSPKGDRIAVGVISSSGNQREIWVFDSNGRNRQKIASSDYEFGTPPQRGEVGFSWSFDGNQITYFDVQGGDIVLMVINGDGSNKRPVVTLAGTVSFPAWSPDGTRILYTTGSRFFSGNVINLVGEALWVTFADGTNQRKIASGPVYSDDFSWSP